MKYLLNFLSVFSFNQQLPAVGDGKLTRTFQDFLINQPAQIDFSYLVFLLVLR